MSMSLEDKKDYIVRAFIQAGLSLGLLSREESMKIRLSEDEVKVLKGTVTAVNALIMANDLTSLRDMFANDKSFWDDLKISLEENFKEEL